MHVQIAEESRPSPLRISVVSLVLSAHLALLLMMSLAQPTLPVLPDAPKASQTPILVDIRPPEPVVVIPPPPMPTAPVRRREHEVEVPIVPAVDPAFAMPAPEVEPLGLTSSHAVTASDFADSAPAAAGFTGLSVLYGPEPPYPMRAKRMRWQGEVLLRIHVGTDGLPSRVEVVRGSGHVELDRAAREHVLRYWRFAPPPFEAMADLPVRFALR